MIGFKLGDPCHFTNYLFRGDWLSVVRIKEKKVLERGEIIVRIAADKETADQRGDLVVTGQEPWLWNQEDLSFTLARPLAVQAALESLPDSRLLLCEARGLESHPGRAVWGLVALD